MAFNLNLPDLPHPDLGGVGEFFSKFKFVIIGVVVVAALGVGGLTFWKHKQAEQQAAIEAEEAAKKYVLTAYSLEELVGGTYYIKDEDKYYPVAPGDLRFNGESDSRIPEQADPYSRILMFGPDDPTIPTLYRDTQLIYKSADFNHPAADGTVPDTPSMYVLERFTDLGYSFGICGLADNEGTGKYKVPIVQTCFYMGSDALRVLQLQENATLILDSVSGTPISANNVSTVGTVKGLKQNETYTLNAYIGTSPVGGQVKADTHMFASFEKYAFQQYTLDPNGYAIIEMPDYMWSGYYYINGVGLFRYINNYKSIGNPSNLDFNTPYYKGTDPNGTILTNPAPAPNNSGIVDQQTAQTSDGATPAGSNASADTEDPFVYEYELTIDNQQKSVAIEIEYSEAMAYSDTDGDGQYQILKSSEGAYIYGADTPTALLVSPTGKRYSLTNVGAVMLDTVVSQPTTEEDPGDGEVNMSASILKGTIDNPELGTWKLKLSGLYARVFNVKTTYTGTSTNMVIKDTSDTTSMTVYIPEPVADAVFKMTWDVKDHLGTFSVRDPEGNEIVSNARESSGELTYPDNVLKEVFGEVDLHVGELAAGEYQIQISGESLGHVYWNCMDLTNGDSSISSDEATEESTEAATEEASTEEATETKSEESTHEK